MAKNIAVVIQEDPRKTHRPVEALRIALGLAAGTHTTTVVLIGEAFRLLTEETDDIIDVDILEKYLPSIEQLEIPFILQQTVRVPQIRDEFNIRRESDAAITAFVRSMDCALVF
jgi:sulfur relay (sulfurtransferase) DsrF/TusC family protein